MTTSVKIKEPTEKTPLLDEKKMEEGGYCGCLQREGKALEEEILHEGEILAEAGMKATMSAKAAGVNIGDTLGQNYMKSPFSMYDKIFMKDVNRTFGDNLEVASRGACFVVVCALPFVTPHEICPLCHDIVESQIYTAASITYFIYTLYVYTGDILHFAQGGIAGSFLAVLNIWMMQGFMPGGYTASKPHRWWLGSLWGISFVFLILWLNFDDNTRIFSLSTYVWYWMAFLKPDATAGFAQNFEIKFNGKAIKELLVAIAGCSIAVIAGYVPYPIYAHEKSMRIARALFDQIYMSKQDFIEYYCGEKRDTLKTKILEREADSLRAEANSIGSLLDSSWYECMGCGKWQRQRVMLMRFQTYVDHTIDLLSNAFAVGLQENFDAKHIKLMESMRPQLEKVVKCNGKVLQACLAVLNTGGIEGNYALVKYAERKAEHAKGHLKQMTADFIKQRKAIGLDILDDECTGENVVGLTFARFTDNTEDFLNSLLYFEDKTQASWRQGGGILGIVSPSVLYDWDHTIWAVRNWLSIVLAFYAGYVGYGQYIHQYNAALASTVSVLLSKFVGSAMTKNLARLQGVVIGIVLGNLLYAFLAWCYWWGHLLVGLALYFWTLMGLFLYYHSENYATVGLLLVVFGTSALLRPCANTETNPSGHSQIVDVTVAIVIMSVVDLCLSRARASDMAIDAFEAASSTIKDYLVNRLFADNVEKMPIRKGELAVLINTAKTLGNEAGLEPRYHRHNWQSANFNQGIACLTGIRFALNAIESAVLDDPEETDMRNRKKTETFKAAVALDAFSGKDGLLKCLIQHYTSIMSALKESVGDDASQDVFVERMNELKKYPARETAKKWKKKMDAFQDALNAEAKKTKGTLSSSLVGKDLANLREDTLSELSVLIECLTGVFTELDKLLKVIIAIVD